MTPLTSRVRKPATLFTILLLVLGAGAAIGYIRIATRAENIYQSAEKSYARGLQAFNADDPTAAARRFDEAYLRTKKAEDAAVRRFQNLPANSDEAKRVQDLIGQVFWLRARALRDRAYARALAEQQPLAEVADSTTGEKYCSLWAIPDRESREEALYALQEAANLQPADSEILKSALRTELVIQAPRWDRIEFLARNILKTNPTDSRGHYLLARYEFEQPQKQRDGGFEPTAFEKRTVSRVERAREHAAKSKESGKYPLWRTLYLEADLHRWFAFHFDKNKRIADKEREERALHALLFDATKGALRRAKSGDDMSQMSTWDVRGLLGLHQLALERLMQGRKKADAGERARILETATATLAVCSTVSAGGAFSSETAEAAILAAATVEPLWVEQPTPVTREQLDAVSAIIATARDKKAASPAAFAALARLQWREAYRQRKREELGWKQLDQQALAVVEEGIKAGHDIRLPEAALADLHGMAAEQKYLRGAKRPELEAHLSALLHVTGPGARHAHAVANFLDGTLAEREGRLEVARSRLEQVVASNESDLLLRTYLLLGSVYMALQQPEPAIRVLTTVEQAREGAEHLSAADKAWIAELAPKPTQLSGLLAAAHLDAAKAIMVREIRAHPNVPVEYSLIRTHEEAVQRVLDKIPALDPVNLYVRCTWAAYLAATGRVDQAAEVHVRLVKDYPDSIEVLKLGVNIQIQRALAGAGAKKSVVADRVLRDEIDVKVQQFIARYPGSRQAKLYWAEWLTSSGRGAKAVAYLNDRANFRADKDEAFQRILALALVAAGDREGALKVLQFLPENPTNDLMLIQFAVNAEEQAKRLGTALHRYENDGLIRCWNARQALNAERYGDAANAYFRALDISRVKALAADGLQRSLLALAQNEPAKALEMITDMRKTRPAEPALLLSLAYVHFQLNQLGSPADKYERSRTMAGALNAWEAAQSGNPASERAAAPLTKAHFWVLANQLDEARHEAGRALQIDENHAGAITLLAGLNLDLGTPELLQETRSLVTKLRATQPDNVQARILAAAVEERDGKDQAASAELERVVKQAPTQSAAWARWLHLLEKRGDKSQALAVVRSWRRQQPDERLAAENEVRLLASGGQLAEARRAAEEFAARVVKNVEARKDSVPPVGADLAAWSKQQQAQAARTVRVAQLALATAYARAGIWDEVEVWLKPVLEKQPGDESALLIRGEVCYARKMYPQAQASYAEIIKHNPYSGVARNNLAWLLATQDRDYAQAYPIAQQARKSRFSEQLLSGDRLDPDFLDTLGTIYRGWGRADLYPEMRELFEAAYRRYPRDPRICLYLGDALAGLGQQQRAELLYSQALSLAANPDPANPAAKDYKDVIPKVEESRSRLKVTTSRR